MRASEGGACATRVLLVGKGEPERGGIPSFLHALRHSPLAGRYHLDFLNLASTEAPEGGRFTIGNLRRTLRDARRVSGEARGADVVHVHTAFAPATTAARAGLIAVVARIRRARVIVHVHGGRLPLWANRARSRALARVALMPANVVVAVAADGHRVLRDLAPDRVRLVENGVDTAVFEPASRPGEAGVPSVLYAGLLSPRKGVLDLFEASRRLVLQGIAHELVVVGGTPDEGGDAERQVQAATPPHARMLGRRPPEEMPRLYRNADVFCLPSWWEAAPLSVLEAMASGLPVVATAVGDVPRLLGEGAAGVVVPPRDVDSLTDALADLLQSPERRRALGEAGRRLVCERNSLARTLDAIAALYDELSPRKG